MRLIILHPGENKHPHPHFFCPHIVNGQILHRANFSLNILNKTQPCLGEFKTRRNNLHVWKGEKYRGQNPPLYTVIWHKSYNSWMRSLVPFPRDLRGGGRGWENCTMTGTPTLWTWVVWVLDTRAGRGVIHPASSLSCITSTDEWNSEKQQYNGIITHANSQNKYSDTFV